MARKKFYHNYGGQTLAEYAIVIAIVTAVATVTMPYLKDGIQKMIKVAADDVGKQEDSLDNTEDGPWTEEWMSGISDIGERKREFNDGSLRTDIDEYSDAVGSSTTITWEDKYEDEDE